MIHRTKLQFAKAALAAGMIAAGSASAAEIAGTWKFEKAADALNSKAAIKPFKYDTIQVVGLEAGLGQDCFAQLKKGRYDFSSIFRAMLEENLEEKDLASFLKKNFDVELAAEPDFYRLVNPPACRDKFGFAMIAGDRLLVPYAGQTVYSFVRSNGGLVPAGDPRLLGHVQTQLPFNLNNFYDLCAKQLVGKDGRVHESDKCTPVYAPYIARKGTDNKLAQLLGNFDYSKSGAEYTSDYSPPFAKNLNPTYMVLPPLKEVLLVRVEDLETGPNSERNTMGGAYITIKGGKIIEQLNSGCNIDEKYFCVNESGVKLYQLLETGKFQRVK